ncbi:MAG TPA: hypothetical protein VMT21_04045 [Gemmatimonadales bacterium]|nr:hypothetical protein [Gemmatimonadales bacterium]
MRMQMQAKYGWSVAALVSAFALTACSHRAAAPTVPLGAAPGSSRSLPAWVNRGSGAFNDGTRVFYGTGLVDDIGSASLARQVVDTRARAAVAQAVQTYVRQLIRDYQAQTRAESGAEGEGYSDATVVELVNLTLSGVRITEHWQSRDSGNLWALARLDLEEASRALEQANQLNARTRDFIRVRANAEHAFDRLESAAPALQRPQR